MAQPLSFSMRLTRIEARNFLTFGPAGISFAPEPGVNTIVGPNSVGKTNLFRVIDFVESSFGFPPAGVDGFRHRGEGQPDLSVSVRFAPVEIDALATWMVLAGISEQLNPPPNSVLGKDFDYAEALRLSGILVRGLKPVFAELFRREIVYHTRGTGNPARPVYAWVEIPVRGEVLYVPPTPGLTLSAAPLSGWFPVRLKEAALLAFQKAHPAALKVGQSVQRTSDSVLTSFQRKFTLQWLVSQLKGHEALPRAIQLDAVDLRTYEAQRGVSPSEASQFYLFLAARGYASPAIGLRDLLKLILGTSVVRLSNLRSPPSPNPQSEFHTIPTHYGTVTGSEIPAALWRLKDSADSADRRAFVAVRKAFLEATGLEVDAILATIQVAESDANRPGIQRDLQLGGGQEVPQFRDFPTLLFIENRFEFGVDKLSAGFYETLVLIFAAIANASSVVLLDEPATNLHPSKQREVLSILAESIRESGAQMLIISHSPYFVHGQHLRGLVRFSLENGETAIHPLKSEDVAQFETLAKTLGRFPKLVPMLFAKKVLLFEGGTEEAALPIWFQKLRPKLDLSHEGVEIANVEGQGGFRSYAPLLAALKIPFLMIGDAKADSDVQGFKKNAALLPQKNFGNLIETERRQVLERVLKRTPNRKRADSPEICRAVALASSPPPSVKKLWKTVGEFL